MDETEIGGGRRKRLDVSVDEESLWDGDDENGGGELRVVFG